MADSPEPTMDQPYMHAEYLAEVCKAYPTAGALIAWQQQELERLRLRIVILENDLGFMRDGFVKKGSTDV